MSRSAEALDLDVAGEPDAPNATTGAEAPPTAFDAALARERIPNRSALAPALLIDELVRAGVRDVCVSPGSRSAPLASAVIAHGGLRAWSRSERRACPRRRDPELLRNGTSDLHQRLKHRHQISISA